MQEAQQLLLECLQTLAGEAASATGSDRKLFEGWSQHHRETYLELFPDTLEQVETPTMNP